MISLIHWFYDEPHELSWEAGPAAGNAYPPVYGTAQVAQLCPPARPEPAKNGSGSARALKSSGESRRHS
jgi:hypothetical protein